MELYKTIENAEVKTENNKLIKEAWKIVYPYGTCPRKNIDIKNEVLIFIKKYNEKSFPARMLEEKAEEFEKFINFLNKNFK